MKLGEKIRLARQEYGLSQRQLCGEVITRNMLSQIENGTASPSMATLQFLASQLGKPMSYFLEENAVVSANQEIMAAAQKAFDSGDYDGAVAALEKYQSPDPVYDREKELVLSLSLLELAEQAVASGKNGYARDLMRRVSETGTPYFKQELDARCARILGRLPGSRAGSLCDALPNLDEDLLLRARKAMEEGRFSRAGQLLEAAEDHQQHMWNLLRGIVYMGEGRYRDAVTCLITAESVYPTEAAENLERCYRELGDYKMAYQYVYKRRERE